MRARRKDNIEVVFGEQVGFVALLGRDASSGKFIFSYRPWVLESRRESWNLLRHMRIKTLRKMACVMLLILLAACQFNPVSQTPLPARPVSERASILKDMHLQTDDSAVQSEIARRVKDFANQEATKLAAANRATLAGFQALQAAGGVQAMLERRLAEIQTAPPALTAAGRAQQAAWVTAINQRLGTLAFCTQPIAFLAPQTITPGQVAEIDGCHFGATPGSVSLSGPFPGGSLTLDIQSWSDSAILVKMPSIIGVPDGAATLHIEPPGMPAASVDTAFLATRAFNILYPAQYADCDRKTQDDFCGYYANDPGHYAFDGSHWSRGLFFGAGGSDRYYAELKNGWVIATYPGAVFINWNGYTSCGYWWSNDAGHVSSTTGFSPGSSIMDGRINWWVDANCSGIDYDALIVIQGPMGVPFY